MPSTQPCAASPLPHGSGFRNRMPCIERRRMTRFRLHWNPQPGCGQSHGKSLVACIAGALLASTIAHAELPVAVPTASASVLAHQRDANIHLDSLPASRAGDSPRLSVHRSRRASPPDVRIDLRTPLVLDGHALRLRLSDPGRACVRIALVPGHRHTYLPLSLMLATKVMRRSSSEYQYSSEVNRGNTREPASLEADQVGYFSPLTTYSSESSRV
jgi:hypothetical protein